MKTSRKRLPFVVTTAAVLSGCGGNSDGGASRGDGGSAGVSVGGMGGTSTAGEGGSSGSGTGECPAEAPRYLGCLGVGAGTTCDYAVACQSSEQTVRFTCDSAGYWQAGGNCDLPYDYCADADVECRGGDWTPRHPEPFVGNPPPPCPAEKPAPGSSCADSTLEWGSPTCGYSCPNGTEWTVGSCHASGPVWAFDGACAGDCSNAPLLAYVEFKRSCKKVSDCQIVRISGCSTITDHCSGTFYVNQSADPAEIRRLDQDLEACQAAGCTRCGQPAPAAACVDNRCVPADGS
ncbi:MAG: hypothetical protein H6718_16885 [Polyangiaceae bacterium]|nr:hypothetical protein [Myxococcales bacterium]MCB9587077.1 hypothetical protein [Polyangiaceae bacterium]MCB9609548.1 hypothetical protein [Polyangiaceae bacterium]